MSSRSGAFPAPNVSRTTPLSGGEDEKRNERKKAAEMPGKMRRIAERRKRWVSGRDHMGEAGKKSITHRRRCTSLTAQKGKIESA